jgi:hypothetical protein
MENRRLGSSTLYTGHSVLLMVISELHESDCLFIARLSQRPCYCMWCGVAVDSWLDKHRNLDTHTVQQQHGDQVI